MSARDVTTTTARRTTTTSSEDGAAPLQVRLAAPPLAGVLQIVSALVASALALYLVWRLRGVIQLLAIGLFFAFALFPVVDAVAVRTRGPRALVILAVYLMVAVRAQLRHNRTFRHYDDRYHITARLVRDARRLPEELARQAGPLKDVTVSAASFVTQLLSVLSITFLLALCGRRYAEMGLALTGVRHPRYRQMLIDIKDAVAGYTLGNIVISVLATIATWIVLSINSRRPARDPSAAAIQIILRDWWSVRKLHADEGENDR
jgi:predicted PurR-regulated permease PerM